ncbi:hypothetical protein CHISP_3633 [Chitinispirillum alkaliphilum]|nr:hypothetical protein CHISP_3633 [Chitinispirillum alkaliphilum]
MFRKYKKRSWYSGTLKILFLQVIIYKIARLFMRLTEKQGCNSAKLNKRKKNG